MGHPRYSSAMSEENRRYALAERPEGLINEDTFDEISLAARRFDTMLRRLRMGDGAS